MAETLKTGTQSSATVTVDDARCISFMGDELRVYATPSIVADLEYACLELLDQYCEDTHSSVGAHVSIDHLRPTPIGSSATFEIEVTEVDWPKVAFNVVVSDPVGVVAKATHVRFVVEKNKLAGGIAAKKKKIAGAS